MANNIFKELEKGSLTGLKRCISLFPSSVSAKNSAGATPLHVASAQGLSAFVKDLLVHGAPHDITDGQGNLPLHLAAEQGSLETVTELLSGPGRKLVVKAKNREGLTPLHLAVKKGHVAVVAKLLEAGARTDIKDKAGITPLELVSAEDEEMLQLLLDGTPTSSLGSVSQGIGTAAFSTRALDVSHSSRLGASGALTPIPSGSSLGTRFSTPPPVTVSGGGRIPAATPSTPPSRMAGQGSGLVSARSSHAAALGGTPGGATGRAVGAAGGTPGGLSSRLPRNASMGPSTSAAAPAAAAAAANSATVAGTAGNPSINAQFQKQDAAIQALKAGLRTATERLGAVDACATAQLECAAQVEKALEACGANSRSLADLEARVGFQEERGRDARSRLERLEEGERSLQASVARLVDDQRGMGTQLQRLADQVAASSAGAAHQQQQQQQQAMPSQAQIQMQSEIAVLKAQLDQLSPALMMATAASTEARTMAARLDSLQQQVQQQVQQQAAQQAQQQHTSLGGSVLLDQQVLQLQAQVQLLQLPVASLTQQCADLSTRLTGVTEWQQQARSELTRLAEASAQSHANQDSGKMGGELSDAVMRVLDTTARTMAELRAQQDETAKQVLALQQQLNQQQQQPIPSSVPGTPAPSAQPAIPGTPTSTRHISLGGLPSLGSMARDVAAQAELRAELEAIKSQMADVRKEVASEGGSLRREWQRAFSDMQSRYGEQANELRSREQNISKLREAMLVEEAERRAASEYEEKTAKRLGKLETGLEYITHRLEVLEEQVSGLASTLAGTGSPPVVALSPAGMPPAGRLPLSKQGSRSTPRSGAGPVSENHSCATSPASHLTAAAAATLASSLMAAAWSGPCRASWSNGGEAPRAGAAAAGGPSMGPQVGSVRGRVESQTPSPLGPKASRLQYNSGGAGVSGLASNPLYNATVGTPTVKGHDVEEWWSAATPKPAPPVVELGDVGRAPAADRRMPRPAELARPSVQTGSVGRQDRTDGACFSACSEIVPAGATDGANVLREEGQGAGMADVHGMGFTRSFRPQQVQQPQLVAAAGGVDAAMASTWVQPGLQTAGTHFLQSNVLIGGLGLGLQPSIGQSPQRPALICGGTELALDPASLAVGPQLLPAVAQALLAPSVDIQRLAAAAVAQQQEQERMLMTQGLHFQTASSQLQQSGQAIGMADALRTVGPNGGMMAAGTVASGEALAQSPLPAHDRPAGSRSAHVSPHPTGSRKEPPMCFFCPIQ